MIMRFLARKRQGEGLQAQSSSLPKPEQAYPLPKGVPLGDCLIDAIANKEISPEATKALIAAAKERSLDELAEAAGLIDKDNVLKRISQKGGPYRSRSEYISDAEDISEKGTGILLAAIQEKAGESMVPDWKESAATFRMKSVRALGYAIRCGFLTPFTPMVLMEEHPVLGFFGLMAGGCGFIFATEKLGWSAGALFAGYVAITATIGMILGAFLGWHEKRERIRQRQISPEIGPMLERLPSSIKESLCKMAPTIRALLSKGGNAKAELPIAKPDESDDEASEIAGEETPNSEEPMDTDAQQKFRFPEAEEAEMEAGDSEDGLRKKA